MDQRSPYVDHFGRDNESRIKCVMEVTMTKHEHHEPAVIDLGRVVDETKGGGVSKDDGFGLEQIQAGLCDD